MRKAAAALSGVVVSMVLLTSPAGAQGSSPGLNPPCTGMATLDDGTTINPRESSGVFEVPQQSDVSYSGSSNGSTEPTEVPERKINGYVKVLTPPGLPDIELTEAWTWDDPDATGAYKAGATDYDLPSSIIGIELTVEGKHFEDDALLCEGSVTIKVAGSATDNPLTWVALGGTAITAAGVAFAGKPKNRSTA